ncbi:MAG: hypothetical protein ABS942_05130 [Solibacillus sp.]|uniref:hypothetical protein n=1 Tax=Solibacillus sp. TaxID=1909654 RepID=UPI0033157C69
MLILNVLVGYGALYTVIWLHEVGHGLMYSKYDCKENPFNVNVPFYLFFSTPQPVNIERAQFLTSKQFFHIGMAGIVVNLILGVPLALLLLEIELQVSLFLFFIYSFTLFHLVEAATYLTISNLFLSSDMVTVQQYKPRLRIPLFIIGLGIIALIIMMIIESPNEWRIAYIVSIFIMVLCMGLGRFFFTRKFKSI